jgi:hypothetical protein
MFVAGGSRFGIFRLQEILVFIRPSEYRRTLPEQRKDQKPWRKKDRDQLLQMACAHWAPRAGSVLIRVKRGACLPLNGDSYFSGKPAHDL